MTDPEELSNAFRLALIQHLGWAEHLDHGLTPATVNTDSYWDEGFGGTDVTPADPSVFYLDASATCPCGESLRRRLENEQVAEFPQAVSR